MITYLHSTVVLLKVLGNFMENFSNNAFTFYCSSIKSCIISNNVIDSNCNLHSTVVLLKV